VSEPDRTPTTAQAERTRARLLEHAVALSRWAPLPGGVLAVVGPDGVLAEGSFGYADLGRGTPMTQDHLFQIGSISKVFTSLLVTELATQGLLSLDDPITAHLDWVVLGSEGERPTLRELLSHMGGLVMGTDFPPDELAQAWRLRDCVVAGRPRRFHYSNVGFMLLGLAASARLAQPLAELVTDRLLAPMGMTRSVAAVTYDERSALAVGYAPAREDRPWAPGDPLAPAAWPAISSGDGNVAATAGDLAQLVRLLLGDGQVGARPVVSPATVTAMTTPTAEGGEPVPAFPPLPAVGSSTYGLGINVEHVGGHELLTHGGGMVGFSTFLLVDRTAGFGVVVLTNANGDNLEAQQLARAAHADLVARVAGLPEVPLPDPDRRARSARLPAAARALLGTPLSSGGTDDLVLTEGDEGVVRVAYGGAHGTLYRTSTGRHVTDHPALRTFHLDLAEDPPRWLHGAATFAPAASGTPAATAAIEGHYRSYSPWFPHLRVLAREGRLLLVAPGGVEAPAEEEELVEVSPGTFRVGSDPWLPGRLVAGPTVAGRAVSVELDGCVYSRTFTP
jgi:D-alanyl-D-alanine carboxypeptidase